MIKPIHYTICIQPDLQKLIFQGSVEIKILLDEPVAEIILNAKNLAFHSCLINYKSDASNDTSTLECKVMIHPQKEEVSIQFPIALVGEIFLSINYSGNINNDYVGLYCSKFLDEGEHKIIASTQFEAKGARRAFPCFDQPSKKATFDIETVLPEELTGISNTSIENEEYTSDGKKRICFERTPKMSTYLVFFAIGEFEYITDHLREPLIRVFATPGKAHYGEFALEMARKSLRFGEEYTGISYPLSKCDLIGIPDSIGAMENYGAIRHAEDVLLVYPDATSTSQRILIAKIIAHECIHMWFGNLVSPLTWNDLWLNESFATYFTYVIPNHFYAEWRIWEQFFLERLLPGLERDSLAGTIAINLPNLDNLNADPAPTPSTSPIIYNKGAAVIRMLKSYLGESLFRQALHNFLEKYAFDSANSEIFWDSVATSTNMSVKAFSKAWIDQPGYPLIEVSQHDHTLELSQERFSYGDEIIAEDWIIPVDIALYFDHGEMKTKKVVLDRSSQVVSIPDGLKAYKLNANFTGFYRTNYQDENWKSLGELMFEQNLSAIDSLNVLSDFFALVKTGTYTVDEYIEYIKLYCCEENRYLPLMNIAMNLSYLYRIMATHRAEIAYVGGIIFDHALETAGYIPENNENSLTSELRVKLLESAYLLGFNRVSQFGITQFQNLLDNKTIGRDILGPVLKIGAAENIAAKSYLINQCKKFDLPESERILTLEALGYIQEEGALLEALTFNLEEISRSLQQHMLVTASKNLTAQGWFWDWFEANFPRIEKLPRHVVERIIVQVVPVSGIGHRDRATELLNGFVADHPLAEDSVRMTLEKLELNRIFVKRT